MEFWTNPTVIAVLIAAVVIGYLVVRNKKPVDVRLPIVSAEDMVRAINDTAPRCICGDVAMYPPPVLRRSRGALDLLRSVYGAPPRYKREVDMMRPPIYCSSHVHVADAMMDAFIFGIRSDYSQLNARIATQAAGFEQEALRKQLAESLTDDQKRASRKPSSVAIVRVLPARTGTDDESST